MPSEPHGARSTGSTDAADHPVDDSETVPSAGRRPRRASWRTLALVSFATAGTLFVTSALDSQGSDLRASSVTDLSTVVLSQRNDTDTLQQRVSSLTRQVNALSVGVGDKTVSRLQRRIAVVGGPAGMQPASGPGLTVTLRDAPISVVHRAIADGFPPEETFVVHQQDIQAVVNALWLGGAAAMTLMGQRIITTTGIRCAGPTVILRGVPFAPPYVIKAVGDPTRLQAALDASDYIDGFRAAVRDYGLGYDAAPSDRLDLPGYQGSTQLRYARALSTAG